MADNPERLAQIMQRMQVSNQRTLGNRFSGGYSGASSANAPTPPSEQIDFTKNTLSPPSMAQPDDTGPGQQMPSVIQPPASGNVGMPSGGNAYSGSQPGVSPSTRDLYSLPDYSGGMRGGMGGDDRLDRLLKMLSSYMGSQMAPPSAAPPPAPVEATPPSIDQPELQNPVEYTGGSQLPAPSPAPTPAPSPSPSPNMPVNEYQPGYTPPSVPAGIKAPDGAGLAVMGDMYNTKTGQRYATTSSGYSAEPGSGWVSQGQTGYVATTPGGTPGQATPDMVRLDGNRVEQFSGTTRPGTYTPHEYTGDPSLLASNTPSLSSLDGRSPQAMPSTPATMGNKYESLRQSPYIPSNFGQADEPRASTMQYTPEDYKRDQERRASGNLNEQELMQKNNPEMYNSAMRIPQANDTPEQQEQSRRASEWYSSQQRPITNDPKSPNFNPNLNVYGEKGRDMSLATIESAALSPGGLTPDMQMLRIAGLDTPSLSSLDGRSPQGMPSIPATMGNEYKSRMMERDNSLNKFNALSEQEKASVLKNLRISTS